MNGFETFALVACAASSFTAGVAVTVASYEGYFKGEKKIEDRRKVGDIGDDGKPGLPFKTEPDVDNSDYSIRPFVKAVATSLLCMQKDWKFSSEATGGKYFSIDNYYRFTGISCVGLPFRQGPFFPSVYSEQDASDCKSLRDGTIRVYISHFEERPGHSFQLNPGEALYLLIAVEKFLHETRVVRKRRTDEEVQAAIVANKPRIRVKCEPST